MLYNNIIKPDEGEASFEVQQVPQGAWRSMPAKIARASRAGSMRPTVVYVC